jgi:muramidase (phage lysozyme)
MTSWLPILAVLALAAYLARRQAVPVAIEADDSAQETTFMEDLTVAIDPTTYTEPNASPLGAENNKRAFLDMIAYAEGTNGPLGYQTLFGGGTFTDFADHPRQRFAFTNKRGERLYTTAAGRYQFLARTWDSLAAKLHLPDFGPESQDAAALELVRQRGALADVQAGRLQIAIAKCAPIWASLPGAGYAQPERKMAHLLNAFSQAGGNIMEA